MKRRVLYSIGISTFAALSILLLFLDFKYNDEVIVINRGEVRFDSVTIVPTDTKVIQLDSLTTQFSIDYCRYWTDNSGKQYVVYLNPGAKMLYFNDFKSGERLSSIALGQYDSSPKFKSQGFEVINGDSILVYSYNGKVLYLLSRSRGKILQKTMYDDLDKTDLSLVVPYVSNSSPITYDKNTSRVYMSGLFGDEGGTRAIDSERNVLVSLDLNSGQLTCFQQYPEFYWGANWAGIAGYRLVSFCRANENELLLSFMASHELLLLNPASGESRQIYAGSKFISQIKSMPYSGNYFDFISSDEKSEYYLRNPSYSAVIHDPFNKVYYRFAQLPKIERSKIPTVIVLNEQFQIIGESQLPPEQFYLPQFFVSEKGLWVLENTKSEDTATFRLLELKPK